jgi:predicted dinucleotide-binding enzyme
MNIAIIGAGGKMGCRLTNNLVKTSHTLLLVEVSEEGKARIAQNGQQVAAQDEALARADAVILALPDRVLGKVAHGVVPQVRPGCMIVTLDPRRRMRASCRSGMTSRSLCRIHAIRACSSIWKRRRSARTSSAA